MDTTVMLLPLLLLATLATLTSGQCPWPRTPHHASLHSDCVCGYSNVRRLSVQCSPMANFSQLLEILHSPSVQRLPIDLLYINNATGLNVLPKNAFRKLDIQQIHLANTRLESIERGAFSGLEDKLISLTLQAIGLREIPVAEIKHLRSLHSLDLSQNRIRRIKSGTFRDLNQLTTLRLAFNAELQLEVDAFQGIERSLKNLNLKATGQRNVPEAIQNLTELAFLDLAQNKLEEIQPRIFENLHLLTALSLERNLIRTLHPNTFLGLNESLSSLSLLNNMLVEFPHLPLAKLAGIRVLDLGFNAIRTLPHSAFRANTLLTLLALDGNPLRTLSHRTFAHLNSTLRGISIGGKLFECDCKVRWLAEWALEYGLQISSRERNPQFCAKPPHLRNKPFTHIELDDFVCPPLVDEARHHHHHNKPPHHSTSTSTTTTSDLLVTGPATVTPVYIPQSSTTSASESTTSSTTTTLEPEVETPAVSYLPQITQSKPYEEEPRSPEEKRPEPTTSANVGIPQVIPVKIETQNMIRVVENPRRNVTRIQVANGNTNRIEAPNTASLRLTEVTYRNNTVLLKWDPLKPSPSGYQVVYRYFGSKDYYRSEPISGKSHRHTLANYIATNELIVICVISLDDPENLAHLMNGTSGQCRELNTKDPKKSIIQRTNPPNTTTFASLYPSLKRLNDIDKIVIAISATVCVFIIAAVLIFSCCFYRSPSKDSPLRTLTTNATCLSSKSLSPMTKAMEREWDSMSVYSTRSIPRARITNILGPPLPGATLHQSTCYDAHPVSRYFGSTLPSKSSLRNGWMDGYLQHYPTMGHIPASVSYGTTVTATGGGPQTGHSPRMFSYTNGCDPYGRNVNSLGRLARNLDRNKGSFSSEVHFQQQRNRKSNKARTKSSRLHSDHRASSNRLLLSSSSNSYQSNEYDSDWNNHHSQTQAKASDKFTDNEVDIYIDQNYARRFY